MTVRQFKKKQVTAEPGRRKRFVHYLSSDDYTRFRIRTPAQGGSLFPKIIISTVTFFLFAVGILGLVREVVTVF